MAKLTKVERHNIAVEYFYGASAAILAERYNIAVNYVYRIAQNHPMNKITPRNKIKASTQCKTTPIIDKRKQQHRSHYYPRTTAGSIYKDRQKEIEQNRRDVFEAVSDHVYKQKCHQRGFVIPKSREREYIELLKTGKYTREEAAREVLGQK